MKTVIVLIVVTAAESLYSQVDPVWVARYNGPGNNTDYANALVVDGAGNVYVTGESYAGGTGSDVGTIKYSPSGIARWVARYNGTEDNIDGGSSIAVDASGNTYVAGYSSDIAGSSDYVTIKYDSTGFQKWVARYDGPQNSNDVATSIVIDRSGNVYVTGYSHGVGTSSDYATVGYSPFGVQRWVARYNGPGNSSDIANAIGVDDSGNVYVTGISGGVDVDVDFATIKYDPEGVEQWVARYDGQAQMSDGALAIAVYGSGDVYVAGSSEGVGSGSDYAVVKYSPQGTQQWVSRYNGPGNSSDIARAIALDDSESIYIAGQSYGDGTGFDYATVRYSGGGVQLWAVRYNGSDNRNDVAYSIAVRSGGYVQVTGFTMSNATGSNYATIQYDSAGVQRIEAIYNGPGNSSDIARSIATDIFGNVYVTGQSYGGGTGTDYATIKYAPQLTGVTTTFPEAPVDAVLYDNYPNPFNPTTQIVFRIPDFGFVSLKVFDVLGREVATLVNEELQPGSYRISFAPNGHAGGMYFYSLTAGNQTQVRKMVLLK